jgi:Rad3-related DNA helicase
MEPLENLVRIRKLKAEAFAVAEFDGLVRSARARLKDAGNPQLSVDSRFDLAYNAAHAFALAALRFHGYRSDSRYLVFQCLEHTLKLPREQWRVLDQAHNKRNIAEYSGETEIDEPLLEALLRVARILEVQVPALRTSTN